jgi:hypothetical protein
MKLKNKLILVGVLFGLMGCSNPAQVERLNPETVVANTPGQNFKALQDKFNSDNSSTQTGSTAAGNITQNQSENIAPIVFENKPSRILFDTGKNPLGNTDKNNIKQLEALTNVLVKYKFSTVFSPLSEQKSLENFDVIALISPSQEYSPAEIKTLTDFVKAGKKVVVTGEWGGYSGFNRDAVNPFLKQVNLRINQDLVKETENVNYKSNSQQILVSSFQQNNLTSNVKKLALFSTASIEIIDENNSIKPQIVALSSVNSFKIKGTEKQAGLIATSNLELGKVIVIGDTSLFTNQQVNSDSKVNLEEENNEQFALNIFSN